MEAIFWKKRWEKNGIEFHCCEVNAQLKNFWDELSVGREKQEAILVPLCGKSIDLLWLAQHDLRVDGIELSEIAVNAFFRENNLPFKHQIEPDFEHFYAGNIHIYLGDFFCAPKLRRTYKLAYDNLGLCALSEDFRTRYVSTLSDLMAPGGKVLMNIVEHQPESSSEPPFSVSEMAMRDLFEKDFKVIVIDRKHRANGHPQVKDGRLSYFDDVTYLLTCR